MSEPQFDFFNPKKEEIEAYIERFDQFAIAHEITDPTKLRASFLCKVGRETYALIRNLLAPAKPETKSYVDIVKALTDHFGKSKNEIAERYRFHLLRQKDGQSISEFLAILRQKAKYCGFANLDEALRDQLVVGLKSESMRKRLFYEKALTLAKAIEITESVESAEQEARAVQSSTATVLNLRSKPSRPNHKSSKSEEKRSTNSESSFIVCYRCAEPGHKANVCKFKNVLCNKCQKKGHIAKACRGGQRAEQKRSKFDFNTNVLRPECESDDSDYIHNVRSVVPINQLRSVRSAPPITVELSINSTPLSMELDTGAAYTVIGERDWNSQFHSIPLERPGVQVKDYSDNPISTLGEAIVRVQYGNQIRELPIVVTKSNSPPLLGRDWLRVLKLDWPKFLQNYIHSVQPESCGESTFSKFTREFPELFKPGLGCMKGPPVSLRLKEGATPKFHKPRPIPFAIREQVEKEIDNFDRLGVTAPIPYSEWAAPIVPVPKPNGRVRICADFSVTVNPQLEVEQYPLPRVEEIFAKLQGGQKFSKVDLSQAYLQVPIDEESQKILVINTCKGLRKFLRLPYGASSSPAAFQRRTDSVVADLPMTAAFLDDIVLTGRNDDEHKLNLRALLKRLQDAGLRVNPEKCSFMQPSIEYLGHIIDSLGIHPSEAKIGAILNMPFPKSVTELRSFMGRVNFYSEYLPKLATVASPLNEMLRKDREVRETPESLAAFVKVKDLMASMEVRCHYDPELPVKLYCDASPVGLGAEIRHVFPDGSERLITAASKTLTETEKNYSQVDKEAYALVYGVRKFHQYLYGRKFVVCTDHKALLAIFGSKKGVPTLAASRLQRYAIILNAYSPDYVFIPGTQNCAADALSRFPAGTDEAFELEMGKINCIEPCISDVTPLTAKQIAAETAHDPVLAKVRSYIQKGWPAKLSASEQGLQPYFIQRNDISFDNGCILWGSRVVIPSKFQGQLLEQLHETHSGMSRMKAVARMYFWWPKLGETIEAFVRNCDSCSANRPDPPKISGSNSWPRARAPWSRLHIDFAGPFMNKNFFLLMDSESKWPEVFVMKSITSAKVIDVLRSLFARFGLPDTIVSDNGTQFTSAEYGNFCKANGISLVLTPTYHPASNGQAERFVQTFKSALKAAVGEAEGDEIHEKLSKFLFSYRCTPHSTTGKCPAEILLGRFPKTRFDLLRPKVERERPNCATGKGFSIGNKVWARNYRGKPKWLPGMVQKRIGQYCYGVEVNGKVWNRHYEQLRLRYGDQSPMEGDDSFPFWSDAEPITPPAPIPAVAIPPALEPPVIPRQRRAPDFFQAGF